MNRDVDLATKNWELEAVQNDHVLQSLANVEVHLKLLTAANRPEALINAARRYLGCWDEFRIKNVQKIDGGWGPFDRHQRPERIGGLVHLMQTAENLRKHCLALKEAGFDATPELLELDRYFSFANQVAQGLVAARQHPHTVDSDLRRVGWTGDIVAVTA